MQKIILALFIIQFYFYLFLDINICFCFFERLSTYLFFLLLPQQHPYNNFLNISSACKWVYLKNILTSLCPGIKATSGILNPFSKNREIASWRKSWKYTSYETRNKTSYETLVKDTSNLESYVQFVKRGQRLTSISDDMVKEMYRRRLITAQEYKNW